MCKKLLAACLAALLILLSFGCGKGENDPAASGTDDTAANGKIVIVVCSSAQAPEVYAAASEIVKAHPASVSLVEIPQTYHLDATAVTRIAKSAVEDEDVKAILFADGVKGTGAAVKAVREARDDICIAVCNPHEGSVEIKGANLILSVDFPALGEAMVKQAKEMGAKNFVFYTTNRHLKYSSVVALRQAAEKACEDEKLTFKATSCVDLRDGGRTPESAKKHLSEDVPRIEADLGKKTALVCTEPQLQGALASAAVKHGMVMPATFIPSPLSLAADLGVDLTGHETDSAYAMTQLRAQGVGAAGVVATWGFSAYVGFLQAAYDYAAGVLNGSGNATTVERVEKWLSGHTADAQVTVTTDANGAYLVQSALVVL